MLYYVDGNQYCTLSQTNSGNLSRAYANFSRDRERFSISPWRWTSRNSLPATRDVNRCLEHSNSFKLPTDVGRKSYNYYRIMNATYCRNTTNNFSFGLHTNDTLARFATAYGILNKYGILNFRHFFIYCICI